MPVNPRPVSGPPVMGRRQRWSLAAVPALLAGGAMVLAACGGGSSNRSSTAATAAPAAQPAATATGAGAASTAAPSGPTVVTVTTAKFGPILADAKGLALYTRDRRHGDAERLHRWLFDGLAASAPAVRADPARGRTRRDRSGHLHETAGRPGHLSRQTPLYLVQGHQSGSGHRSRRR